ncbi:hypothetical protein LJK87_10420 [Paenibacillus sp. P25]|nr:hypothetical protein LJK87_10420 [Paenibacillus sp. P25]
MYKAMKDINRSWAVAGGWAIDLFLGRATREHHDIEILIFRQDQVNLREYLQGWDFRKVVAGEVKPWSPGEWLELPIHETYAEKSDQKIEILLNEFDGANWVYRRDKRIHMNYINVVSQMNSEQKDWLQNSLTVIYGRHPWVEKLT